MFELIKFFKKFLSTFYWNYKIKNSFMFNGFRIADVNQINNPKKIKLGFGVTIRGGVILNCQPNNEKKSLFIGNNCQIGRDVQINAYSKVIISNNVLISDRVHISDASHNFRLNKPILKQGAKFYGPIIIEDGVWIGINVVILPNVKIGKNSVIGANSVVNKNVPSNSIAIGASLLKIKKK